MEWRLCGCWYFPDAISVLSSVFTVISQDFYEPFSLSPRLSSPSLSRARASCNSSSLNPRGLAGAFSRDVAADDCMDVWPTSCCRHHRRCPCASVCAAQLLTQCHLHQLMTELLLVAEECKVLPVLGSVPGFKKGVCCAGYRLFFSCLSPTSKLDPFCPCCLQSVCLPVPSFSSPHTFYPWMNLFLSGTLTKIFPFPCRRNVKSGGLRGFLASAPWHAAEEVLLRC